MRSDRLATLLDIPVATSISGQGSLPETHPNCVGVVGSNGGTDETWEAMAGADLVIFMGCRAGSTTTSRWEAPRPGTRIVHFDIDPMVVGAVLPTEVGVVGDLRLALDALNEELARMGQETAFDGAGTAADIRRRKFERFDAIAQSDAYPIRPERVIATLQRCLPEDATIVSDPGTSCPYLSAYYTLPRAGRHFITNRAHGALGLFPFGRAGRMVRRAAPQDGRAHGRRVVRVHLRRTGNGDARTRADHLHRAVEFKLRMDQGQPARRLRRPLLQCRLPTQ